VEKLSNFAHQPAAGAMTAAVAIERMAYRDMVPSAYVQGQASSRRFAMLKMDGRRPAGRIPQCKRQQSRQAFDSRFGCTTNRMLNMGLLGILVGLGLLIWLAFRGWSVLLLAPVAALVAAFLGGEPLLANWTQVFMGSAARFLAQFFPLFLLGAAFGKLMEDNGAVWAVADFITKRLGERRVMLAVVLAGAFVTYGGVSLFVAFFVLAPMAQTLFRAAAIPAILEERARRQKRTREIRPASCCGLAAAQCSLKTNNYFCNQVFLTRFFHVEFTKGVYRRLIDYGQRGV
jgi:GntP family permease